MDNNFIGNRIRDLRKIYGKSSNQFAVMIGSSSGYISDMENGKNTPSVDMLVKICSGLGISLSEFFNDDDIPLSPELFKLLESARKLTPDQLSALQVFLNTITEKAGE
ncbi:MAG: helix-turn-helix transcriptional regulator [Syntrophomonas sp.]